MSARSELDAARPVLARMDLSRGPDHTRADLMTVCAAAESALRMLLGNTGETGQALIRDARARQLLTFDQANALVALLAVREQLDRPDYQPTDADVNAARLAFLKLDAGLMDRASAPPPPEYPPQPYGTPAPSPYAQGGSSAPKAAIVSPIVPPAPGLEPVMRQPRQRWVLPAVIAAAVIVGLAIMWLALSGRGGSAATMTQGIQAYQRGDKVTASSDFEQAARANPGDAMPHVYLARMAREVGNYTIANQELQLALRAEPKSLTARREYGALFLSMGNYDKARVWYEHALEVDPNDVTSQGWLGCALIKLGRIDQGMTFLNRARNGPWSTCGNAALLTAPGTTRP